MTEEDVGLETEARPVRTSIRPKDRFEVFKRDGFTCQYCGRKTPNVVLEIDHIIPVVAGGDNDLANLITSCWECNRGKGAALLDDRAPVPEPHDQAVLLLEREMQLREYNTVKRQVRERIAREFAELDLYWSRLFQVDLENGEYPFDNNLRYWLQCMAIEDLKDCMDQAAGHNPSRPWQAVRYLSGIVRNKIEDARGSG